MQSTMKGGFNVKINIRKGCFETNSSSMHSVCISKNETEFSTIKVEVGDNMVHVPFGQFGWEVKEYRDPYTKLQYALTMVLETESIKSEEDFYNSEGFKAINEVVESHLNCDGVIVDDKFDTGRYGIDTYIDTEGYIDHQSSVDSYKSLQDFLDENGISLEDFIFNTKVILKTDNDNHY